MKRRLLGRFRRGDVTVEFLILFPILLGTFFVAIGFGLAALTRAEVAAAARSAARVAAIECGQGDSTWAANATQAALTQLAQGGLRLGSEVPDPTQAGDWYVGTYCSSFGQTGGIATVQVQYAVLNLFPQFGSLEAGAGEAGAWRLNQVASFPTE